MPSNISKHKSNLPRVLVSGDFISTIFHDSCVSIDIGSNGYVDDKEIMEWAIEFSEILDNQISPINLILDFKERFKSNKNIINFNERRRG